LARFILLWEFGIKEFAFSRLTGWLEGAYALRSLQFLFPKFQRDEKESHHYHDVSGNEFAVMNLAPGDSVKSALEFQPCAPHRERRLRQTLTPDTQASTFPERGKNRAVQSKTMAR
jgi:hypothetical protein